jgi:FtsZ-interacting cell division protein ZipA
LGLDSEANTGYDDNTADISAVDEMRVEASRSSRRFSQRAQKFASPERQKKKSVDTVIPDDAKGTSQGKLSYSPVSPTMVDNQLESEVDADTGAADLEKPKKMVVITLHPQVENTVFKGSEIRSLMETFSLTLSSKSGFYECMDGLAFSGKAETIFSVGHLRGTGRFERTKLPSLETSGLIFFMTIPGPVNAADAIDMMFSIGAKAAKMLNAKLCDQKKSKLTVEQMINIRDEAVSFEKALMDQNLL